MNDKVSYDELYNGLVKAKFIYRVSILFAILSIIASIYVSISISLWFMILFAMLVIHINGSSNKLSYISISIKELVAFKKLYDKVTKNETDEEKIKQVNSLIDQSSYRVKHGMSFIDSITRLKKDMEHLSG